MDLKPLFPEHSQMETATQGGILAEQLVLTLPIKLDESIEHQALEDLKRAYLFIVDASGNSEATFKAYRSAIERFLLFLWIKQGKSLTEMHKRDFLAFLEFAQNPDPEWVGLHTRRFAEGFANPLWRPFTLKPEKGKTQEEIKPQYKCSKKTIESVIARLSSFFSQLQADEYINVNPVMLIRNKSKHIKKDDVTRPVKRLTNRQMEYCLVASDLMATEIPEMHERTRFIMHFMLSLYLRISEMVPGERHVPNMKDFVRDHDGLWWFTVVGGKGNKDRLIPMDDDDLANLARYRVSRELPPYPTFSGEEPLIHKVRGTGQITSDRSIRVIIQSCFDRAKRNLMNDGHVQDASTLHEATAHWLRHTGISEDLNANGRPLAHVADDAGHNDIKTTSIYIDSDMRDRHNSKTKRNA